MTQLQLACYLAVKNVLGQSCVENKIERSLRYLEESIELVQSIGLSKEQAQKILNRVYDRPVNPYVADEIGGSMFTLMVLAATLNFDPMICCDEALTYFCKNAEKIQENHHKKLEEGVSII